MNKIPKKFLIGGAVIVVFAILGFAFLTNLAVSNEPSEYADFAKCLTANGVKMYGAKWCSHCKDQKKSFGNSWQYVNYIECSVPNGNGQTLECRTARIEGYPTWEFANGERMSGFIPLSELGRKTSCSLP